MRAPLLAAALVSLLLTAPPPAAGDHLFGEVVVFLEGAETVTTGSRTSGTYPGCTTQAGDGLTCVYTEGDAGNGETHDASLLPTSDGTAEQWTETGCVIGDEYTCVDEGASHDSDITYVRDQSPLPATSRYNVQDATGQSWEISGTTYNSVTSWMYARRVDGAGASGSTTTRTFLPGTGACGGGSTNVLTTSYANYSGTASAPCPPWTLAKLDSMMAEIVSSGVVAEDEQRVTATGLVVNLRHPNWRNLVTFDFIGAEVGATTILDLRAAASADGETYALQVYDWIAAAYTTRLTISGGSLPDDIDGTDYTYELASLSEIATDGTVRMRFVDGTQSVDETQGTLTWDYGVLRTRRVLQHGGGGLRPTGACDYNAFTQEARCRDTTPWPATAQVLSVCFVLDGRVGRCTTAFGSVPLPSGDGFFATGTTRHTLNVTATFGSGARATQLLAVAFDNTPRILLWVGLAIVVPLLLYAAWKWSRRRRERQAAKGSWRRHTGGGR